MPCCLASNQKNSHGGGEHGENIDKVIARVKGFSFRSILLFCVRQIGNLSFNTIFATCHRRVSRKPGNIKFFLADKTLAVLTGLYPAQSAVDLLELTLAQPGAFLGDLLSMHGISAGKAAHAGLIKFHLLRRLFR